MTNATPHPLSLKIIFKKVYVKGKCYGTGWTVKKIHQLACGPINKQNAKTNEERQRARVMIKCLLIDKGQASKMGSYIFLSLDVQTSSQ